MGLQQVTPSECMQIVKNMCLLGTRSFKTTRPQLGREVQVESRIEQCLVSQSTK